MTTVPTVSSTTVPASTTATPSSTIAPSSSSIARPDTMTTAAAQAGDSCCTTCVSSLWNKITYPIRYAFIYLTRHYPMFTTISKPFVFVAHKLEDAFETIAYTVKNWIRTPQFPLTAEQLEQRQSTYWRLGRHKMIEGMERSFYESYGPEVFDRGLHGGAVEPGFRRSWERAAKWLSYQFQRKVDADFYLDLHKISCGHFMGGLNGVLIGQEQVGRFRNLHDIIRWNCSSAPNSTYSVYPEADQDLQALNVEIQARFGTTLGRFVRDSNGGDTMIYTTLSADQVRAIYNYFSANLYTEIANAQNQDEKLVAICKFFKRTEALHSVKDGCGRNDLFIFNFLLTQNGFHPACINAPFLCNTYGLNDWVHYVRQGMHAWSILNPDTMTVANA